MTTPDKEKKTIAVIGYGSQGRAIALNLRDSGWKVVIGLRPRSKSLAKAKRDKFTQICLIPGAVRQAKTVIMAIPDHEHGRVFEGRIRRSLSVDSTLVFLHGLSVHFGLVQPPRTCDIVLVAPHAPGVALREKYLTDRTISAFVAVKQNPSKSAWKTARVVASGIGISPGRLVKTTFEHEAVGDIFGEQAVLCGGLAMLIKHGFDTLVKSGVPPDNAWLEVAYQIDLIIGLIKQHGISGMFDRVSVAAKFGSLTAGPRIIDASVKRRMKKQLAEIKSGRFARTLSKLSTKEIAGLSRSLASLTSPALEKSARKFAVKSR